ncbi:hypothetical protein [Dyadobacter sp. CY343]|uniref:hypothetical protein n=1 Tax=Dyadobacter sp. CY343 TaxID=2907299 RepID=UPI001F1820E2|nr:hypothetical protein [Dyadobacter sp. CY343]MCE7062777.1 hypothetical protein [Dyadobacter sp. CY343]
MIKNNHHYSSLFIIIIHHHYSSSLFIIIIHHHYSSSLFIIIIHHHYSSSLFIIPGLKPGAIDFGLALCASRLFTFHSLWVETCGDDFKMAPRAHSPINTRRLQSTERPAAH